MGRLVWRHKRLRVKVAEEDTTLQGWVAMAIKKELARHDQNGKNEELIQRRNQ